MIGRAALRADGAWLGGGVVLLPMSCFFDLLRGESSNEQGAETDATGDTVPSRWYMPLARRLTSTSGR